METKKIRIKIFTRSFSLELYTLSRTLYEGLEIPIVRLTDQTADGYFYTMLKDTECDIAINIDEDAFVVNPQAMLDLVEFVVIHGYANAGCPDGGGGCPRAGNPLVTNPFFNVFNLELIRTKFISKKDVQAFRYESVKQEMKSQFPMDMLETLLTAAKQKHTDMAYCHAWEHKANKMRLLKSVTFRSNKQFLSQFVARLWTILFRRDFLLNHNINFPLTRSAEDSCMIAAAIMQASSIVCIDKPLYHYIVYSESVSHKRDKQRIAQKYASFSWLFKYAKETGLYDFYYCQLWWIYFKKVVLVTLFK